MQNKTARGDRLSQQTRPREAVEVRGARAGREGYS